MRNHFFKINFNRFYSKIYENLDGAFCIFPKTVGRVDPRTLIRPSKDHKLKPLGLPIFFRKMSGRGVRRKLEKKRGGQIDSILVFPGLI